MLALTSASNTDSYKYIDLNGDFHIVKFHLNTAFTTPKIFFDSSNRIIEVNSDRLPSEEFITNINNKCDILDLTGWVASFDTQAITPSPVEEEYSSIMYIIECTGLGVIASFPVILYVFFIFELHRLFNITY